MEEKTIVIEFPLRGEWLTPTTPAKRVTSHGTNRMGLRYAFDFLQIDFDRKVKSFHRLSYIRYLFFGVLLEKCYCWGENMLFDIIFRWEAKHSGVFTTKLGGAFISDWVGYLGNVGLCEVIVVV